MVDWCKIEEVLLRSQQQISCPICLYPPVAGKITKCGHIYCWPCILNYLALGENKWRKCPICFESIYKDDLKSVRILKTDEYKVGDSIELNLIFKEKSSTLIYPLNLLKFFELKKPTCLNDFANSKDYDECKKYLKLQAVNSVYINEEILKRETNELRKELSSGDCEDNVKFFINESLSLLEKRENFKVNERDESPKVENLTKTVTAEATVRYKDEFDLTINDSDPEELLNPQPSINGNKDEDNDEDNQSPTMTNTTNGYSYFYQAKDGQRIFMNSLNLRCLIFEYKTIESCPLKIEGKIVAIENMFMTEELRKRFRYLAHIPLHSEFLCIALIM